MKKHADVGVGSITPGWYQSEAEQGIGGDSMLNIKEEVGGNDTVKNGATIGDGC
jgi:hypothetical protein